MKPNPLGSVRRMSLACGLGLAIWLVWGLPLARAQNNVFITTNRYQIQGQSIEELRRSLNQLRPWKASARPHDAQTEWRTRMQYRTVTLPGIAWCTNFATVTQITMTLPGWTATNGASAATLREWNRYLRALAEHEAGHARHAREGTLELHRRVKALEAQPDAETVRQRLDALLAEVQQQVRQQDADYDRETRHGATQGALFPLPPGGPPPPPPPRAEPPAPAIP